MLWEPQICWANALGSKVGSRGALRWGSGHHFCFQPTVLLLFDISTTDLNKASFALKEMPKAPVTAAPLSSLP